MMKLMAAEMKKKISIMKKKNDEVDDDDEIIIIQILKQIYINYIVYHTILKIMYSLQTISY